VLEVLIQVLVVVLEVLLLVVEQDLVEMVVQEFL
jgi:hypothetical protein